MRKARVLAPTRLQATAVLLRPDRYGGERNCSTCLLADLFGVTAARPQASFIHLRE